MKKFLKIGVFIGMFLLWTPPSYSSAPPERVVLVTIDTLRYDHLPFSGYRRNTAPFLQTLADRGVLFERAYATASHTAPSLSSFLTGVLPFQHGVLRNGEEIRDGIDPLPDVLRTRGYRSGAFSGVRFLEPIGKSFDVFQAGQKEGKFYWFIQGEQVVSKAKEWVLSQAPNEKIFLWVHLYDVHQRLGTQYDYSQAKKDLLQGPQLDAVAASDYYEKRNGVNPKFLSQENVDLVSLMDDYDARILYVDRQIKDLWSFMEKRFPTGETLWIISADHGEGLGSHNLMSHGRFLYQEQIRVPLIFAFSKKTLPARRVTQPVSTMDVFPTVLSSLGIKTAPVRQTLEGVSLEPYFNARPRLAMSRLIFSQRRPANAARIQKEGWETGTVLSLVKEPFKFILRTDHPDEFYDLDADPLEERDLHPENLQEEEALKRLIEAKFGSYLTGGETTEQESRSEFLEELKALGYAN